MKNMLYGIGLLLSGSIGMGACLIAINQSEMRFALSIAQKISESKMSFPFTLFAVLAIIGLIISTKEFFKE